MYLSLRCTASPILPRCYRITDAQLKAFIEQELSTCGLGANTFEEAALDLILRNVLCASRAISVMAASCKPASPKNATC